MSITGTITTEEQGPGHRSTDRLLLQLSTRGVTADGHAARVLIHNLSATGLLVETQLDLPLGRKLSIELPEVGEVLASVLWRGSEHGYIWRSRRRVRASAVIVPHPLVR